MTDYRVRRIDSHNFEVLGATEGQVTQAVQNALRKRSPIDHGPLPPIAAEFVKAMVGAVTRPEYTAHGAAREHVLGRGLYRTEFDVRQRGDRVHVTRHTEGILGPGANLGDFPGAVNDELLPIMNRVRR